MKVRSSPKNPPWLRGLTLCGTAAIALLATGASGGGCQPGAKLLAASDAASPTASATTTVAAPTPGTPIDAGVDASTVPPEEREGYVSPRALSSACNIAQNGRRIADADRLVSFTSTKDPFALVNRAPQGTLANDDAPEDLVRLFDLKPSTALACMGVPCLRKSAAEGLRVLLAEMQKRGFAGMVESAFRSYPIQCGTFTRWATQGGFCSAVEQSALPGHSQHQLGTVVDLFTKAWHDADQNVFRNGFGCTPGGLFLRDEAWRYGWILSYPIHPDDRAKVRTCETRSDRVVGVNPRTGYKNEAWHIRFLGIEEAAAFHETFEKAAGTVDEPTLEQWLRKKQGLGAPETELPVCDGCRCGACSTLAPEPGSPEAADPKAAKDAVCNGGALFLDVHGVVKRNPTGAHLGEVVAVRHDEVLELTAEVTLDLRTVTQPPLATGGHFMQYTSGEDYMHARPLVDLAARPFRERAGAIRLGVGDGGTTDFPYRVGLTSNPAAEVWGRENVLLPTFPGKMMVRIAVPLPKGKTVAVALVHDGTSYDGKQISF